MTLSDIFNFISSPFKYVAGYLLDVYDLRKRRVEVNKTAENLELLKKQLEVKKTKVQDEEKNNAELKSRIEREGEELAVHQVVLKSKIRRQEERETSFNDEVDEAVKNKFQRLKDNFYKEQEDEIKRHKKEIIELEGEITELKVKKEKLEIDVKALSRIEDMDLEGAARRVISTMPQHRDNINNFFYDNSRETNFNIDDSSATYNHNVLDVDVSSTSISKRSAQAIFSTKHAGLNASESQDVFSSQPFSSTTTRRTRIKQH